MKHTLTYDIPEERSELNIAMNGIKFYCRIIDYNEELRRKIKYSDLSENELQVIQKMYDSFFEYFKDIINDESFM